MRFAGALVAGTVLLASPLAGEVTALSEAGFVSQSTAQVAASRQSVWDAVIAPAGWWDAKHTYFADAGNMSLVPEAGGCFCERIPAAKDGAGAGQAGSVEHMRVIYADPGKQLRLSGGLGPLQSEAVTGTLTITLRPVDGGTQIVFDYIVGGYMRYKTGEIGPLVDAVLGQQLDRLAAKLGRAGPSPR